MKKLLAILLAAVPMFHELSHLPVIVDPSHATGIARMVPPMALAEKFGFTYVGGHPMAGTQYSGIKYSKENMYVGAPMVIVPPRYDDIELLDKIKKLLLPAGFGKITVTTAEKHDEMLKRLFEEGKRMKEEVDG